jgi:hypothetical protein
MAAPPRICTSGPSFDLYWRPLLGFMLAGPSYDLYWRVLSKIYTGMSFLGFIMAAPPRICTSGPSFDLYWRPLLGFMLAGPS